MDPVKAAKIKKRTLVGGGLSLALVGLLWLAHVDTQHVFVPVVGLAVALGGALELARMDRLGGKDLRVPLFAALFATTVVHFVNNLGDAFGSGHDRLGYEGWWGCWLAVLVFTAIVLPVRRLPRGPGGVVRWAAAIPTGRPSIRPKPVMILAPCVGWISKKFPSSTTFPMSSRMS